MAFGQCACLKSVSRTITMQCLILPAITAAEKAHRHELLTYGRANVPTFIFFLDILHVKKVSNITTSTQQYPLLLRIKSYF